MRRWLKRPMLRVAVLIVLAGVSLPARSKPEVAPQETFLAGQLLVAAPNIGDPRFERTVVLLLKHNQNGALGIVINRPIGERPLSELMTVIGEDPTGVTGNVPIFAGGPVQPDAGFVLHSTEYRRAETQDVGAGLAVTSTHEILVDIAHHKGPKKALIAFGYAGWGPGQLENEISLHGWFTAPADPKLIFDDDREKVWQDAMARRTQEL